MTTKVFGKTKKGEEIQLYTLKRGNIQLSVTNYGAALVELLVEKDGKVTDVVLGYDTVAGYEVNGCFFGVPVGRSANRIGGAGFELGGKTYNLDKNEKNNNLHSGLDFYIHRIWQVASQEDYKIVFSLHSPDGDQGYPGNLDIQASYEITDDNMVLLGYHGIPDQDTIINMTNHSYFNLNGHASGDILGHEVTIEADFFTATDEDSIPTGELTGVTGTPMDFRSPRVIGAEIDADYEATRIGLGYDHNWVLKNEGKFVKVAEAIGEQSGIKMEVYTDLPGLQFYTGNMMVEEKGKENTTYLRRGGFCFETQYFPDAIHHPSFAGSICKAGEEYRTFTGYRFVI